MDLVYLVLADLVVVVHFLFVAFALLGGLLVLRWPRLLWIHLPAAVWGVSIEMAGWICPLTPLEQALRRQAGLPPYEGGFLAHYLLPVLYPEGLTRETQWLLAGVVLGVNAVVYGLLARRRWWGRSAPKDDGKDGVDGCDGPPGGIAGGGPA